MTTSYADDAEDRLTHAHKGLTESYVDGTTHVHAWVTWSPLTFRQLPEGSSEHAWF